MLEVDIDDSGTVDFFEFLCVARLISQGKGTSEAFIVPKLGKKVLYFFIGSIILICIHIFSFFRGSSSFQEEDFDSSAKTEYSVQSLCCAITVQGNVLKWHEKCSIFRFDTPLSKHEIIDIFQV